MRRWSRGAKVLALTSIGVTLVSLDISIVNVAFRSIVAEWPESRRTLTWVFSAYNIVYASPHLDAGPEAHNRLKILKEMSLRLYGRETLTGTLRWGVDFKPLDYSQAFTSDYTAEGGEWGIGEWGEAEFGTGLRLRNERIAMGQEGQYVQVYLSIGSTDVADIVSIQELVLYLKLGTYV